MNDQLQKALTEFVNRAIQLIDTGAAQLPAVLQDIVAYALFDAWFFTILGVGFLLIGLAGLILFWSNDHGDGGFVAVAGLIVGGIMAPSGIYHVYYVTHFPRLVILDYIRGLL